MPFRRAADLRYFQFESLSHNKLLHAIFTRQGGVSPEPWQSLNFGASVGDRLDRVRRNKQLALESLQQSPKLSFDVWQIHSAKVVRATGPRLREPPQRADGIVTDVEQLTLVMRFADCVPILVYDPPTHSVGMAHAGWQGTLRGIAARLVERMQADFGARPETMLAGIGPSIGPDHYPVGPEVVEQVEGTFGEGADQHLKRQGSATHFDLWSANKAQLEAAGLRSIEVAGLCTACHMEDWYSHRGEQGRTGRFGAIVSLGG